MGLTKGTLAYMFGGECGHIRGGGSPSGATVTIDGATTRGAWSSYSIRVNGSAGYYQTNNFSALGGVSAALTDFAIAMPFRIAAWPQSGGVDETFGLFDPAINLLPYVRTTSGGSRRIVLSQRATAGGPSDVGTAVWTGSYALNPGGTNPWYILMVQMYRFDTNRFWPARVKLYDTTGATLHDDSGWQGQLDSSGGAASTNAFYLGTTAPTTTGTLDLNIDDVIVVSGGVGAPLDCRIVGLVPTGDSATDNAWTESVGFSDGDGNKFDENDERPPNDDTDYMNSTANSQFQTFTHGASGAGNVVGVATYVRHRSQVAGNTKMIQHAIRTSGGRAVGGFYSSTDSYAYSHRLWPRSQANGQWTATGGAETDVDACEFGLGTAGLGLGTGNARCTQCIMEVAYGTEWTDDYTRQRQFVSLP